MSGSKPNSTTGLPISKTLGKSSLKGGYDYVIVGSGYGGSIAASRLAAAGKTVLLLERGREIIPGQYPRDLDKVRKEVQVVTGYGAGRLDPDANGMLEVRVNEDVHVITGNGLGGGSLVNAGVSIEPDMRVFDNGWPAAFRPNGKPGQRSNTLSVRFARVKANLGAAILPEKHQNLPKLKALEESANALKQKFELAEINVTFEDGPNAFGFEQLGCNMCGDCCSGCNYGAKNTLLMNYLPDAHRSGAQIITEAEVTSISRRGDLWMLNVLDRTKPLYENYEPQEPTRIAANHVIMAAGSVGTTEILQRSLDRDSSLTFSCALGSKFSANGDVLGFGFGANVPGSLGKDGDATPLYSIGAGVNLPESGDEFQPGPCITGIIRVDMDDAKPLQSGMLIEDGVAPGALAAIYPAMFFLQDALNSDFTEFPDAAARLQALQQLGARVHEGEDLESQSYTGVMTQMQSYLTMSHDTGAGRLEYRSGWDVSVLEWPGAGDDPVFHRDNKILTQVSEAIWANYIPNPLWSEGFNWNIVSVHPLGGCPMSDNEVDGVTNADCKVYKGNGTNEVYEDLMICDGSVIPTCLGVNPLLTISAITERAMDQLLGGFQKVEHKTERLLPVLDYSGPPAESTWSDVQLNIYKTSAAIEAASTYASIVGKFGLKEIITTFVSYVLGSDVKGLDGFLDTLLKESDLEGDFSTGLASLAEALTKLGNAPSAKSGNPGQNFVDALFELADDISPALSFDESMSGWISSHPLSGYPEIEDPFKLGKAYGPIDGQACAAELTINASTTRGVNQRGNIKAQIVEADLTGWVTLYDKDENGDFNEQSNFDVINGKFSLLQPDQDAVETWVMTYNCELQAECDDKPSWKMSGTKYLRQRPGSFWWTDLTTLFVEFEPINNPNLDPKRGIIELNLRLFLLQMTTLKVRFNSAVTLEELKTQILEAAKNKTLDKAICDRSPNSLMYKTFNLLLASWSEEETDLWPYKLARGLEKFFGLGIAQTFGQLTFRAYGDFVSYMADFPSQTDKFLEPFPNPDHENGEGLRYKDIPLPNADAPIVRLYHFAAPQPSTSKGPVMLAPGMSTTALGYAIQTIDTSLVERLLGENYDVWLCDPRFSPRVTPINTDYTLDDVAKEDWPLALEYILANTPVPNATKIKVIAHCVGALTMQMSLLGGHLDMSKISQMVLMQFTVHPSTSWFNAVKTDAGLAKGFVDGFPPMLAAQVRAEMGSGEGWKEVEDLLEHGIKSVNPISPPQDSPEYHIPFDPLLNSLTWNIPYGIDRKCNSPACHRIYGLYGPVIAHDQINEATHNAMRWMYGEIATKPFEQLGLIMARGRAVSSEGEDIYLPNVDRMDVPIHILSGSVNQIVLPESGYFTQMWLKKMLPHNAEKFTRTVVNKYAHNDCFIGKNANRDIFGGILEALTRWDEP